MKHKVKIGRDNKFYGLKKDTYKEGEKVTFYIMVASDMSYYITSEQVKINNEYRNDYSKVYYSFIMSDEDVVVDIDSRNDMTCLNNDYNPEIKKEKPLDNNKRYCKDCGLELNPGIKFCPECGCKTDI